MSSIGKEHALQLIGGRHAAISAFKNTSANSMEVNTWKQTTGLYLEKVFGSDSKSAKAFEKIAFWPLARSDGMDVVYWDQLKFNLTTSLTCFLSPRRGLLMRVFWV